MLKRHLLTLSIGLVVLFSAMMFFLTISKNYQLEFQDAKIFEGNPTDGGKEGTLSLQVFSALNRTVNCHITYEIRQLFTLKISESVEQTIAPGVQTINISIILPDGKNRVNAFAECT